MDLCLHLHERALGRVVDRHIKLLRYRNHPW